MDVENNATTDSLRDDIAAAIGGVSDTTSTSSDTGSAGSASASSAADDSTSTSQTTSSDRARDEHGRFTKRQENQNQQSADANVDPATQTTEQQQQAAAAAAAAAKKAPQSWKQELKTHFESLPPEVQDEILRRESDYNKGIQKYAESAKFAEEVRPAFEQWMPYLSQIGATPAQAFDALLKSEYVLRTGSPSQKQQMLMQLARDYGVEIGGNVITQDQQQQQSQQQQQQFQQHPDLQHAVARVQHLEQYIQNLEYNRKQEAARQQEAEMAELNNQVQAFSGSGKAPHYETVKADMAKLLRAGYAESLEDAYEKACWAHPDIRASLMKEQEAKRIREQAEIASKALAKDISITGSPSGASVPIVGASIRSDLEAAFNGVGRI